MDTILFKYRSLENDYLVYDICKYHARIDAHAVRTICARNCGLGSAGVVAGPFPGRNGALEMRMFSPDGEEQTLDGGAYSAGMEYLFDAGYVKDSGIDPQNAKAVGKVFLSDEFVQTYLCAE